MKNLLKYCVALLIPMFISAQNTTQNVEASCSQNFTGASTYIVGMSTGTLIEGFPSSTRIAANDIDVAPNSSFSLSNIVFQLYKFDNTPPTSSEMAIDVYIYEDSSGNIGSLVSSYLDLPIVSISPGTAIGSSGYSVELQLPSPQMLTNATGSVKKYWIGLGNDNIPGPPGGLNIASYWESSMYTANPNSYPAMFNVDGVWSVWISSITGGAAEGIFTIQGDCQALGLADFNQNTVKYYPNPVTDVLHIETETAIKSVDVYNLLGQLVRPNAGIGQGNVDMSSFKAGVYMIRVTMDSNVSETFKVVKK
jgi:hypothetical protein